tara:strand:- start:2082 stop:2234 length:153 start_codon:yes stop_codon:yes gene_type:complete
MAALIIGIFVTLFGGVIMANATFSDRSQMGFYFCLVGLLLFIGGAIELIF